MASLNLAGKNSGYVKITAPDDSSNNPVVTLPTESGELALKSDIGSGGGGDVVAQPPVVFRTDQAVANQQPTAGLHYTISFENSASVEGGTFDGTYFTPSTEGWYQVSGSVFISAPETARVGINLNKNDSNEIEVFNQGISLLGGGSVTASGLVYCNGTTDKISLAVISNETPSVINRTANLTYLSAHKVSSFTEGSGGKTVAFKGQLSASQNIPNKTWTKVNFDEASTDTDNSLVDGKFKPSVAGWYHVDGCVREDCTPASTDTVSRLRKNETDIAYGSQVDSGTGAIRSICSTVVYLDGKEDFVELQAFVATTGTSKISSASASTFLSAVLVSGGSGGGDSIWTEVDGKAFYDGNVGIGTDNPVNGLTVKTNGTQWTGSTYNTYAVPSGNVFIHAKGAKNQDNWIGITGGYEGTSGSSNILLQANNNKINQQAGNYIGSEVVDQFSSALTFGKMMAGADATTTNSTKTEHMRIGSDGRVDITGSLYVNNSPKSLDVMVTDLEKDVKLKDKLIEKLSERLDELEKKLKKAK